MSKKFMTMIGLVLISLLFTSCKPEAVMPNPASVHCEEKGGKLEIRKDESGGEIGFCIFDDGCECEEWAFYRGECQPGDSLAPKADMPNPASVFCEENGGTLEIREDESGGQVGYCIFDDGSECEEWAFYQGKCKPGDSLAPIAGLPNPASVFCVENGGTLEIREDESGGQVGFCIFDDGSECEEWAFFHDECLVDNAYPVAEIAEDGWQVYRNEEVGFSFHYPTDAIITSADDPRQTLTVQGLLVDNAYWPMIFINYPPDRPEFTLPAGTVLDAWLESNNLLMGERLEDTTISGQTAIHLRQHSSEQSYPSDHFFFAKDGRIFNIVFLHTGNLEDWDLYSHFLENFEVH